MMKNIAVLQPLIPHYREEFFSELSKIANVDVYVYENENMVDSTGLKKSNLKTLFIKNKIWHGFLFYSPRILLNRKYDELVLMLHFAHITTWLLLLTKPFHKKKIILWGQGISVKRYLREEKKVDWKLKWQMALSDGVWLYMDKEKDQWIKIFPQKQIVALNNTISGISEILNGDHSSNKEDLKNRYNIVQPVVLIFCARFDRIYRRIDLLLETIKRLDSSLFAFIIIGEGVIKPDFRVYKNVFDFGAVYDSAIKSELFTMADIYYQPGWVGLSIVEAMAYGKPVFTYSRKEDIKQCVEYSYIKSGYNGMIFNDIEECINCLNSIDKSRIQQMGESAKSFAANNLDVSNMVKRAASLL